MTTSSRNKKALPAGKELDVKWSSTEWARPSGFAPRILPDCPHPSVQQARHQGRLYEVECVSCGSLMGIVQVAS